MKAIWTQDEASYPGRFVDFDRDLVVARSPPRRRIRRCWSAATARRVLDRVVAFGDAWFPNFARGDVLERIPELRERAGARGSRSCVMSAPADARALERCARPACSGSSAGCPSAGRSRIERGARALRGRRRGAQRRGVTARERFASARVARLATTGPDGPHIVPIVFALAGDTIYHAVDHKPKRTTALKRLANLRADPRASVLADAYDEDWTRLWWARADGVARILAPGHAARSRSCASATRSTASAARRPGRRDRRHPLDRLDRSSSSATARSWGS